MKAILEFNLPEDQIDFDMATQANKWWAVAWDIDQWLRSQIKYPPDEMSDDKLEAFEECRENLRTLIDGYNLDLDK